MSTGVRQVRDNFLELHNYVTIHQARLAEQLNNAHQDSSRAGVAEYQRLGGRLTDPAPTLGQQALSAAGGAAWSTAKAVAVRAPVGANPGKEVSLGKVSKRFAQSFLKDHPTDGISYIGHFWNGADKVVKLAKGARSAATVITTGGAAASVGALAAVAYLGYEVCDAVDSMQKRVIRAQYKAIIADMDVPYSHAIGPAFSIVKAAEASLKIGIGKVAPPSFGAQMKSMGYNILAGLHANAKRSKSPEEYRRLMAQADPAFVALLKVAPVESHIVILESALLNELEVFFGHYVHTAVYGAFLLERAQDAGNDDVLGWPGYNGYRRKDRARHFDVVARRLLEANRKIKQRILEDIPNTHMFASWLYGRGP